MVLDLIGVVPDGSSVQGAGVPDDPRRELRIQQLADVTVRVQLVTQGGQPVDLTAGSPALTLTARKRPGWSPILTKTGTPAPTLGRGWATFTIASLDTTPNRVRDGRYVYDVVLVQGGKRDSVVPLSPLVIEPACT